MRYVSLRIGTSKLSHCRLRCGSVLCGAKGDTRFLADPDLTADNPWRRDCNGNGHSQV